MQKVKTTNNIVQNDGSHEPLQFNISNIPPQIIELVSDDCAIISTEPRMAYLSSQLNDYLRTVSDWMKVQPAIIWVGIHHMSTCLSKSR